MHPAIKMIIGVLIFLAGIIWYAEGIIFGEYNIANMLGQASNFQAFLTVFAGIFGLVLLVLGAIVAWIEYEDLKWERKEKD